jgi:prophage antirepressor-like protein
MNTITTFTNETLGTVRVTRKNSVEWFVAKDICDILEVGNVSQALTRLDEDEKGIISNDTPGGVQDMLCVNEYGLWQLVLGSRKPQAKEFKRWLTHEVIPAIRQNGGYIDGQEYLPVEEKIALDAKVKELNKTVQTYRNRNENLEHKIKILTRIIECDRTGDLERHKPAPWCKVDIYDNDPEAYEAFQEEMELFNVSEYELMEEFKAIVRSAKSRYIDNAAARHIIGEIDRLFVERNAI